jgi:hypothetical protein
MKNSAHTAAENEVTYYVNTACRQNVELLMLTFNNRVSYIQDPPDVAFYIYF